MSTTTPPRISRGPAVERKPTVAAPPETPLPAWLPVTRGVAMFFGLFLLVQVWNELTFPSASTNWLWIDLRPLRPYAARGVLALHGCLLLLFACSGSEPKPIRTLGWLMTAALFAVSLLNTVRWYSHLAEGAIVSPVRVPLVLQTAAFLSVALAGLSVKSPAQPAERRGGLLLGIVTFDICLVLFPLTYIICAGGLDDRRDADVLVIVVPEGVSDEQQLQQELSRCNELLAKQPALEVCLIGAAKETEPWAEKLAEVSHVAVDDILQIEPARSPGDGKTVLRTLAQEHKWTTVIVCAEPVRLPRLRTDAVRAGLDASQVPLRAEVPNDWSRMFSELPSLWLAQLSVTTSTK